MAQEGGHLCGLRREVQRALGEDVAEALRVPVDLDQLVEGLVPDGVARQLAHLVRVRVRVRVGVRVRIRVRVRVRVRLGLG